MKNVMTPDEFKEQMEYISRKGDTEWRHMDADDLMGEMLTALGYGEGVKIFDDMYKWYA